MDTTARNSAELSAIETSSGTLYEATLPNGLLVLLKPDPKAPVINLNIAYRVGSKFEGPGITGISHLLEHMMFKTSANYALGQFDHQLKQVGADNNAFTWLDQTVYYETIASEQVDVALRLEAERMRNLSLTSEDAEFERTVVRNELDQRDDSPFTLLYEELLATAFVAHPYRVPTIGYKDDVGAISPEDLRAYYDRWYHPDNAFIVAVGDFEPQALLAKIEEHFGAIPAAGFKLPRLTQEPPQQGERRFEIVRAGKVDYLLVGWHIPPATDPDSYALVVLGNILGDGRTSRLYKALVDTGLCAEAAAWASNFGHSDPFLFFCSAMLSEGVHPEAVEPVFYSAIDVLAQQGPTAEELARAKKSARVSFVLDHDSIERQAGALVEFELMSGWRDLDKYIPGIEAVTAEDVKRVAAEYLTKRNRTVGIYNATGLDKKIETATKEPGAHVDKAGEQQIGVTPPGLFGGAGRGPAYSPEGNAASSKGTSSIQQSGSGPAASAPEATHVEVLPNNFTVILRESHGNPTVSLQGLIRTGRIDDPPELPGVANFAIDMLSAGTEQHDKFQLAALFEDNGIELSFSPGRETFSFSGRCLSEDLTTLLDGLAEMLLHSTFPADEVDKSRQQILSELLDSMHSTRAESAVAARRLLYGDANPFAGRITGDPDDVRKIDRDALVAWHSRLSFDGAVITLIGDFETAAALEAIRQRFGSLALLLPDRGALLSRGAEFRDVSGQRQHVPVTEKSNFSAIWIGPGPAKTDPQWPAFFVANFIFGGDFYSRLNERLRVKEGLTYGSGSRFVNGLAQGPLMVTAQISPAKFEQAVASAQDEMAKFAAAGATPDELELARSYLIGNFPVQLSTNSAVAAVLTDSLYLGRGLDYIARYRDIIAGVTLEQVAQAARWYDPTRLALVSAGTLATGTNG